MMQSKIVTDLAVDTALTQAEASRMTREDRLFMDSQIRGIQQHLVDTLLSNKIATYARVDGASASLVQGDVVCVTASGTVTKAVAAALSTSKYAYGVAMTAGAPNGLVLVAIGGVLAPAVTGISTTGYGKINTTTARVTVVGSTTPGEFYIGYAVSGYLSVSPSIVDMTSAIAAEKNGSSVGSSDTINFLDANNAADVTMNSGRIQVNLNNAASIDLDGTVASVDGTLNYSVYTTLTSVNFGAGATAQWELALASFSDNCVIFVVNNSGFQMDVTGQGVGATVSTAVADGSARTFVQFGDNWYPA